MKEETLNDVTRKLLEYAESAETFAQAEIPKYIEELLNYMVIANAFDIALMSVIVFTALIAFIAVLLKYDYLDDNHLAEPLLCVSGIFLVSSIVISICIVPNSAKEIFKIKTAPRVFIIDYLKK
jgi:hypothetical protein